MKTTRRAFIEQSTVAGLGIILASGSRANAAGSKANVEWQNVVNWDHSWDASLAKTYQDDGKSFDIPPAVRVDLVPDANGAEDMKRDVGRFSAPFKLPLIPGPTFQESNPMFGGRASWYSDEVVPHNPEQPGYFYAISSGISTDENYVWPQPWWGAVLARAVGPFEGHNRAYIDGNPGMVTIGISKGKNIQMRAWPEGNVFGPTVNSKIPFSEDTVLVVWSANGEESWLEINYVSPTGMITKRTQGRLVETEMEQLHSGLSHTNYTSCVGIAKGVPTQQQTDAVRQWATPYMPLARQLK